MSFEDKIKFSNDEVSLRVEAEGKAEFKRRTGIDYPETGAEWRSVLGKAGFTPHEARHIRTKFSEESNVSEYFHTHGALLTEIYARLESTPAQRNTGGTKPTAKTVEAIRLIETRLPNDDVATQTGLSVGNVRKIRSKHKAGGYTL